MAVKYLLDAEGNQMTTDAGELLFVDQDSPPPAPRRMKYIVFNTSVALMIFASGLLLVL